MPTLSSSIVKHNVASVRDVEDALARQAVYGGDLLTNLLELSLVSEEQLARLLSDTYEVAAAPAGELPSAGPSVLRLVPRDLARRFNLYPLEQQDDTLVVAVGEPLPGEVESDLGFSLGLRIEQRIALSIRIQQALARDYALPLEQRADRLLAQLAGRPDPNPSVAPGPPSPPSPEPRPAELEPSPEQPSLPAAELEPPPERTSVPEPEPPAERTSALPLEERPAVSQRSLTVDRSQLDLSALTRKEPKPRRRGPYTPAMAERDLLEAEDRDDVLRAFFDFASQYFEYAALFAIHGDLAEGRDAAGSGAPRARVLSLGIPLELPSSLSRAAATDRFSLVRLGAGGLDGAFARDLDRRPGPQTLMLPIRVRKRTVLVFYGDHGHRDVQLEAVGQVISFAPLVSSALEHLILKRKQSSAASIPPRAPLRPRNAPLPRPEERAAALASALGVEEPPVSSRPPSSRASGLARPVIAVGELKRTKTPAHGSLAPPAPRASLAPGRTSQAPLSPAALAPARAADAPVVPAALAPASNAPVVSPPAPSGDPLEEGWDLTFRPRERGTEPGMGTQSRKLELVPEPMNEGPSLEVSEQSEEDALAAEAAGSPEAPEISVGPGAFEDELDLPPDSGGVPLAPASRSLAHSARPLPMANRSEELRLPTVIVDLANDCQALLEQLLAGSSAAGDKLVQLGEPAIAVLAGAFPGPITAELRRGVGSAPSRASECGPILRTLARIGVRAAPVLVVRTADADPNVRAWATRLLGEMPGEDAARAIVRRFIDDEQEVRRAALAAGRLMQNHVEARSMIHAGLADLLGESSRPEVQRHALIEAIADLRDGRAVPTVLRLLEDRSSDIVRSAHWALVVLARQDYGLSAAAWEEWWRQNSARHRIEWLIDALMHESTDIRRAAGDELKSTTKEYFGYYDDLPLLERQKAQTRYREWWEAKGKARFR